MSFFFCQFTSITTHNRAIRSMASALGIVNTRAYIEQLRRDHADSGTYLCLVKERNMYASPAPFHWPDTGAAKVPRHSLVSHPIIFDQPFPRGWLCLGSSSEQTYSYKYMRITLPQKDSVWAKVPRYAAARGCMQPYGERDIYCRNLFDGTKPW